jgi:hypothetical protein
MSQFVVVGLPHQISEVLWNYAASTRLFVLTNRNCSGVFMFHHEGTLDGIQSPGLISGR